MGACRGGVCCHFCLRRLEEWEPQQLPASFNILVLCEQIVQNPEGRLQIQVDNICGRKGKILNLLFVHPHLSSKEWKFTHFRAGGISDKRPHKVLISPSSFSDVPYDALQNSLTPTQSQQSSLGNRRKAPFLIDKSVTEEVYWSESWEKAFGKYCQCLHWLQKQQTNTHTLYKILNLTYPQLSNVTVHK